ncbi:hypothetical protein Tco_0660410 [Tanacetum coccineum]
MVWELMYIPTQSAYLTSKSSIIESTQPWQLRLLSGSLISRTNNICLIKIEIKIIPDMCATKTAIKKKDVSAGVSGTKPDLFLDQLRLDVTGTIIVMIGRVWDVSVVLGRYLSTDFVVSDAKMIYCSARASVAHNFLRLREGGIYSVIFFAVKPNKEEYRVLKDDTFMLEFNGSTTVRKVFVNSD